MELKRYKKCKKERNRKVVQELKGIFAYYIIFLSLFVFLIIGTFYLILQYTRSNGFLE